MRFEICCLETTLWNATRRTAPINCRSFVTDREWKAVSLAPWSRVLLGKLTGPQLVKKFLRFYGTRRFITTFTTARHLSLSWAGSIQSTPPHPTYRRSILILSTHLRLGLPSGLFPPFYPPKPCICLSSPTYVLPAPPISFLPILSPEQYWVSTTDHSAPALLLFNIHLTWRWLTAVEIFRNFY